MAEQSPEIDQHQSSPSWRRQLCDSLESAGDVALSVAILIVPLLMAGVRPAGVALFVLCSFVMGLTWATSEFLQPRSTTKFSGAELVASLSILLVGMQLVALPNELLRTLAPFIAEYLPLWSGSSTIVGEQPWQTISLTPELTRSGFCLLLAYVIFFISLLHRLRDRDDLGHLLQLVALGTVLVAGIGLGQLFFGNGKYLWVIDHPYRDVRGAAQGTFTNPNHFAGFLSLGIGPLLWCWMAGTFTEETTRNSDRRRSKRRDQRTRSETVFGSTSKAERHEHRRLLHWAAVGLATVLFAGLLSLSRGGILAIGIAGLVMTAGMFDHWKRLHRVALPALGFAIVGLLVAGAGPLSEEWASLTSARSFSDLSLGRIELWSAILEASAWFWPAGSGLGSHADVYPTWLERQSDFRFSHAENGYLQVLLELGLPGLLLVVTSITLCGRWCWLAWKGSTGVDRIRTVTIATSLIASALHSTIDFVWYIPGCMIVTLALIALACRNAQLIRQPKEVTNVSRPSWYGVVCAGLLLLLMLPAGVFCSNITNRNLVKLQQRNEYRRLSVETAKAIQASSLNAVDKNLLTRITQLEQCLLRDPRDHAAAIDLSALYLRRFELAAQSGGNRMTLREIQHTVATAGFESNDAIHDWMQRAFGESANDLTRAHWLAHRGLSEFPLRGEAYIVLAELGFLNGMPAEQRKQLVQQALKLRPHDPPILLAAGNLAANQGGIDRAFELWRTASQLDPDIQDNLIQQLAITVPAADLVEQLDLGPQGLLQLYSVHQLQGRVDESQFVAERFLEDLGVHSTSPLADNPRFWRQCHDMLMTAGRQSAAIECLQEAVTRGDRTVRTRRQLAFALLEAGEESAAIKHLKWCQLRAPEDEHVKQILRDLQRGTNQLAIRPIK